MMSAREWSETDIRQLIFQEVSTGDTMRHLNTSIQVMVDETHAGFPEIMRWFEVQVSQITIQEREMKKMSDEVAHIFDDSRAFVSQTQAEQVEAKAKLIFEVQVSHGKK